MNTPRADESPLTPYVPRLLIEWQSEAPEKSCREIAGTLVFVDISGFTAMSERLARRGKVGAEEVTDVLNSAFSSLLTLAWEDGGGLLKFGGDALLLFFSGAEHADRACHAALSMRKTLREFRRLKTSAGVVSLRMSVGIHSGRFHFFLAGDSHRELIVAGPAASQTVAMESAAGAGDILLSPATAAALDERLLGASKGGGRLLRRAPFVQPEQRGHLLPRISLGLSAFVPVAVRERVSAAMDEGEHRQVTISFIHFGGTDVVLADVGPEEVLRRIDELVRVVQRTTSEHEICFLGTDIDQDGGKVILTAGAPQSSGNDEERMLRAVRAIADGDYGLELKAGINRGHVFAGDVGATFRRTYTVMGDAVNLAARLMQRAEPGQVLTTEEVLERSATLFQVTTLEPFAVKGKAQPVVARSVGAISGVRQRRTVKRLPFVGREREIETLCAALESARQGNGSLAELIGEAGSGKSRLVEELRAHCADMTHVEATCEQYESSTPYFALRCLMRPMIGIEPEEDARRAGQRLRQCVQAVAPEFAPWLPLLAIPLDAQVRPTQESTELEPKFRKRRLHQVVIGFLAKLLSGPAALIFEDVHWMDEASCDLLRDLLEEVAAKPWVVCLTRRPDETGLSPPLDVPRSTIRTKPLTPEATTALARAATEEMLLPQHEVAAIAERAGGNPLFLQELAAASEAPGGLESLPESIEAVITARIDTLRPRARTLLRYASVVGSSFSPGFLADILTDQAKDVREAATWDHLREFVDADVSGLFRFRHALFREVAYEGLPYRQRRRLHELVGEALERQDGAEQAELLSLHYHRAQRYEKSWSYSLVAGERAREKFANVEAAGFYRRALEAARRSGTADRVEVVRVSEALGDVCELAALYEEATTAYQGARAQACRDPATETRLLLKQGIIGERSGQYTQALRWYGRGLRGLGVVRPTKRRKAIGVQLGLAYAGVRFRQGRYRDCIRWCHKVLCDAETVGDRASLAHAYYLLDHAHTFLGNPESKRYRALALPIYEELGDLVGQANVLNNLGVEAYFEGRWSEALVLYQRSKNARERAGDVVGAATATNNIGEILSDQGRLSEAEVLFREALSVWRTARYPVGVALATSNLGRAFARGGRLDEAGGLLDEALRLFGEIGAKSFILETEARIAEKSIFGGQHTTALDLATATLERAEEMSGTAVLQAMLHRLRGYATLLAGDTRAALPCLEKSLCLGRSAGAEYEVALTLEILARLSDQGSKREYAAEAWSVLRMLDVVSTPRIPLPDE